MCPGRSLIPDYLRPYVVEQDVSLYTPIDHASWRFILRLAQKFLAGHAHAKYLDGLRETGISIECIPRIEEMDECLSRFGWRAVAVSGFIPPGVFMEFLSMGVLPIACDMRSLEHLSYTPAPDIVHEAAGHAPIIADPQYARYLKSYGELARKAIFSSKDMDVYFAIRELSDIKEDSASSAGKIAQAEARLEKAVAAVDYVSEATQLSRMGWWTFEYGLVGPLTAPKIYGAGLLSSIGESYHCLEPAVRKVPFSLECTRTTYDITRPQPQLFVAENFEQLTRAIEELALQMAFRIGGEEGLRRARQAGTVTTVEFDSGVQVSGVLARTLEEAGKSFYLQFKGPTQVSSQDSQLAGQGADYHREGFGMPLGVLEDGRAPAALTDAELAKGKLKYASGVEVEGRFRSALRKDGTLRIAVFEDCTVKRGSELLFRPEWGVFDLATGSRVVAVFGGAADRGAYLDVTGGFHQKAGRQKSNLTEANRALNALYARVRALREARGEDPAGARNPAAAAELSAVHAELEKSYPQDWLLRFEILEQAPPAAIRDRILERFQAISKLSKDREEMIRRGLELLGA